MHVIFFVIFFSFLRVVDSAVAICRSPLVATMTYKTVVRTHLLLQILYVAVLSAAKLNVPKVLLPFHTGSVTQFTLTASDGCYAW